MLIDAFRLIPALQVIFEREIEYTDEMFVELSAEQYEAFWRRGGQRDVRIFRYNLAEPHVIERTPEKVTWELEIVTEPEMAMLLDGVRFVHRATKELNQSQPTFEKRLEYLRRRLPPIFNSK